MTAPIISITALSKSYETGGVATTVLKNTNFEVHEGEFVAIMGPSGSGKSTFMNIIGCLDRPTTGTYFLNGKNVAQYDKNGIADIRNTMFGFVFQSFNLLPRSNTLNNVALPQVYAGVEKKKRLERAAQLLEKVRVSHRAHGMPNQLSGGEQQRVAIARALANHPRIILADEPTGNLDSATSDEIMELFSELNANDHITIILVTHEPNVARYAKRLVRFKDGHIIYDGSVNILDEEVRK